MFRAGPTFPWFLILTALVVAGGLVMWLYRRIRSELPRNTRRQLVALRLAFFAILALCLLDIFWVRQIDETQPGTVALILDTSRSMAMQDGGEPRIAEAKNALKQAVLPALPRGLKPEFYRLAEQLQPLPDSNWGSPDGRASNLVDGLISLWTLERKAPLRAAILVSDGANTSATPLESAIGLFRRKGVPVHTIAVGGHAEPPDIVIESVETPRLVWAGRPVMIRALVRSPGFAHQAVPIRIESGGKFIVEDTIQLTGEPQEVSLALISRLPGFHFLELQIPQQINERLSANNRRSFGIEVVDGQPRFGILDANDGSFATASAYLQKELGATVTRLEPGSGWGNRMADWLELDGLLISSTGAASCPGEWLHYIARFVHEFGGGLLLTGGPGEFGPFRWQGTSADRILPFLRASEPEPPDLDEPFPLKIFESISEMPILDIGETRAASRVVWESTPPIFGGLNRLGQLRPGTQIVAGHPTLRKNGAPLPVWLARETGNGRVFVFATGITGPWGHEFETNWGEVPASAKPAPTPPANDRRYTRRFWARLGEWLTARKTVRAYQPVEIDLARHVAFVHERVRVMVRARDPDLRPLPEAEVDIGFAHDERSKTRAVYDESLRAHFIDVQADRPGDYLVTARVRLPSGEVTQTETPLRIQAIDLESYDARARPDFLKRLAELTGGASLHATDETLADQLSRLLGRPAARSTLATGSLWNHPFTLLLLTALLAAEWTLRRRSGLA
ncbi:MAG: vWA domain-containing protein [Verrucomicrobiia bacterium]